MPDSPVAGDAEGRAVVAPVTAGLRFRHADGGEIALRLCVVVADATAANDRLRNVAALAAEDGRLTETYRAVVQSRASLHRALAELERIETDLEWSVVVPLLIHDAPAPCEGAGADHLPPVVCPASL